MAITADPLARLHKIPTSAQSSKHEELLRSARALLSGDAQRASAEMIVFIQAAEQHSDEQPFPLHKALMDNYDLYVAFCSDLSAHLVSTKLKKAWDELNAPAALSTEQEMSLMTLADGASKRQHRHIDEQQEDGDAQVLQKLIRVLVNKPLDALQDLGADDKKVRTKLRESTLQYLLPMVASMLRLAADLPLVVSHRTVTTCIQGVADLFDYYGSKRVSSVLNEELPPSSLGRLLVATRNLRTSQDALWLVHNLRPAGNREVQVRDYYREIFSFLIATSYTSAHTVTDDGQLVKTPIAAGQRGHSQAVLDNVEKLTLAQREDIAEKCVRMCTSTEPLSDAQLWKKSVRIAQEAEKMNSRAPRKINLSWSTPLETVTSLMLMLSSALLWVESQGLTVTLLPRDDDDRLLVFGRQWSDIERVDFEENRGPKQIVALRMSAGADNSASSFKVPEDASVPATLKLELFLESDSVNLKDAFKHFGAAGKLHERVRKATTTHLPAEVHKRLSEKLPAVKKHGSAVSPTIDVTDTRSDDKLAMSSEQEESLQEESSTEQMLGTDKAEKERERLDRRSQQMQALSQSNEKQLQSHVAAHDGHDDSLSDVEAADVEGEIEGFWPGQPAPSPARGRKGTITGATEKSPRTSAVSASPESTGVRRSTRVAAKSFNAHLSEQPQGKQQRSDKPPSKRASKATPSSKAAPSPKAAPSSKAAPADEAQTAGMDNGGRSLTRSFSLKEIRSPHSRPAKTFGGREKGARQAKVLEDAETSVEEVNEPESESDLSDADYEEPPGHGLAVPQAKRKRATDKAKDAPTRKTPKRKQKAPSSEKSEDTPKKAPQDRPRPRPRTVRSTAAEETPGTNEAEQKQINTMSELSRKQRISASPLAEEEEHEAQDEVMAQSPAVSPEPARHETIDFDARDVATSRQSEPPSASPKAKEGASARRASSVALGDQVEILVQPPTQVENESLARLRVSDRGSPYRIRIDSAQEAQGLSTDSLRTVRSALKVAGRDSGLSFLGSADGSTGARMLSVNDASNRDASRGTVAAVRQEKAKGNNRKARQAIVPDIAPFPSTPAIAEVVASSRRHRRESDRAIQAVAHERTVSGTDALLEQLQRDVEELAGLTIRELGASLRSAANAGARQANEMVDEAAHEAQETISWAFEMTDRMAFLSEVADKHLIALQEPLDDAPVHDVQKQLRGLRFDSVKLPEQLF